jgi:hypothetical protein
MAMEKAREGSVEERSWKDAPMKAREEAIQLIVCFKCEPGVFWNDGHDHECPNLEENKKTTTKKTDFSIQQAQGELEIQLILCLKCDMGAFWMDGGHADDECPNSNEKMTTTRTKKTGASRPKTERKSRENEKWQVNGKCASGNNKQKLLHPTTTPSAVFALTTITTMCSAGVTTTNTGIHHRPPAQNTDNDAVISTAAAPRLGSLCPSFCSAPPLCRVPQKCCFNWQPFRCQKKQECINRKHHGRRRG